MGCGADVFTQHTALASIDTHTSMGHSIQHCLAIMGGGGLRGAGGLSGHGFVFLIAVPKTRLLLLSLCPGVSFAGRWPVHNCSGPTSLCFASK